MAEQEHAPPASPSPLEGEGRGEGCAPPRDRHWWVKMLLASAALAALLFGAYFLTPGLLLHYHAWQFKSGRDRHGEHLKTTAATLIARHATEGEVVRLLGRSDKSATGHLRYVYAGSPPNTSGGFMEGLEIEIRDGRAVAVQPWSMTWRR